MTDYLKNNWATLALYVVDILGIGLTAAVWYYGWFGGYVTGPVASIVVGYLGRQILVHLKADSAHSKVAADMLRLVSVLDVPAVKSAVQSAIKSVTKTKAGK